MISVKKRNNNSWIHESLYIPSNCIGVDNNLKFEANRAITTNNAHLKIFSPNIKSDFWIYDYLTKLRESKYRICYHRNHLLT